MYLGTLNPDHPREVVHEKNITNCKRKVFYSQVTGLQRQQTTSKPLDLEFGTAVSRAWQQLWIHQFTHKPENPTSLLEVAMNTFNHHYPTLSLEEVQEQEPKTMDGFLDALRKFFQDGLEAEVNRFVPFLYKVRGAVEVPDTRNIGPKAKPRGVAFEIPQTWFDVHTKQLWISATKTTQQLRTNIYDQNLLSYKWAIQQLALLSAGIPMERLGGIRLFVIVFRRPKAGYNCEIRPFDLPFHQGRFREVVQQLKQYLNWQQHVSLSLNPTECEDLYPVNPDTCYEFNRQCPYHGFCTSGVVPEQVDVPDGFEIRWENPLFGEVKKDAATKQLIQKSPEDLERGKTSEQEWKPFNKETRTSITAWADVVRAQAEAFGIVQG